MGSHGPRCPSTRSDAWWGILPSLKLEFASWIGWMVSRSTPGLANLGLGEFLQLSSCLCAPRRSRNCCLRPSWVGEWMISLGGLGTVVDQVDLIALVNPKTRRRLLECAECVQIGRTMNHFINFGHRRFTFCSKGWHSDKYWRSRVRVFVAYPIFLLFIGILLRIFFKAP